MFFYSSFFIPNGQEVILLVLVNRVRISFLIYMLVCLHEPVAKTSVLPCYCFPHLYPESHAFVTT